MSNNLTLRLQEDFNAFNDGIYIIEEKLNSFKNSDTNLQIKYDKFKNENNILENDFLKFKNLEENYLEEVNANLTITSFEDWDNQLGGFVFQSVTDGVYEFKSAKITDNQTCYSQRTFNNVTKISFQYKASSEQGCDFFYFYINGNVEVSQSGPYNSWTSFSKIYSSPATVTLKFEYTKDCCDAQGDDCVYLKDLQIELLTPKIVYTQGEVFKETFSNKFKNYLEDFNFEIKDFENKNLNNEFNVNEFKNEVLTDEIEQKLFKDFVFRSYEKVGINLNIKPTLIILKNFED